MTGSSSAVTATMPPEAQRDSLSTSEFTQVSVSGSFSGDNIDMVLLLSLFSQLNRRETSPLPPLPICFGLRATPGGPHEVTHGREALQV